MMPKSHLPTGGEFSDDQCAPTEKADGLESSKPERQDGDGNAVII